MGVVRLAPAPSATREAFTTAGLVAGIRQGIEASQGANNGIAATASAATVIADTNGLRLTHVTDLQIVNGGQTTATLAGAMTDKDSGLDQTFVQMKLSVLPAETSG
ncbi:MAG: AIPR family protein, partial [Thermoplasmata archaeon]